jgi:hypothetical protein
VGFAAGSAGPSFSLGPLAISCCFRAFEEKKTNFKNGENSFVAFAVFVLDWCFQS